MLDHEICTIPMLSLKSTSVGVNNCRWSHVSDFNREAIMNIRYWNLHVAVCVSLTFASLAFAETKASTQSGNSNTRPTDQKLTREQMNSIAQGLNDSKITRDCNQPPGQSIECCTTNFPGGKWCVTCFDTWKDYKQISHDCGPKQSLAF
ncbi:MAG: hypothetical protein RL326_1498 [Pseudomonadota bacterium]